MNIQRILKESRKITFLTGAGVSVDSGIPDFKSVDSTWDYRIPRHEAISIEFFRRNPEEFWKVYRQLFESKMKASPNPFHRWIASLEPAHDVTVITQNVDGLHTASRSSKVIEMHGSVDRVVCTRGSCSQVYPAVEYASIAVPKCDRCRKVLKPDVCSFGEPVTKYPLAESEIENSDLLIVAGTSLEVTPVSLLPLVAENSERFIRRLWINKSRSPEGYFFTDSYNGTFSSFLKLV